MMKGNIWEYATGVYIHKNTTSPGYINDMMLGNTAVFSQINVKWIQGQSYCWVTLTKPDFMQLLMASCTG